ncbi:ensconsin isoform X1 [Takifugu rubripes]|uniref:Ensconsin-like n=1 Tax=Takifugu rubripes TaxID=31033 RepID=A0A674PPK3_TAKRU|nr:ensconsin-like isoform X1 [Takifugu rubripes]
MRVPVSDMAVQMTRMVVPEAQGPLSTQTLQSQTKGTRNSGMRDNQQTNRPVCSVHSSAQINTALPRTTAVANGTNIDEKLRAARERREEQLKFLAFREKNRLEREQRARQYYEQQLKERKRKLLEHRLKEEKRRAAVEEKRRQRLKEEKERFESAVRKTVEKSQRAQQNQNTRGRRLWKDAPGRLPLTTWEKNLVTRLLTPTFSYLARSKSAGFQSGEEVVPVCRRAASYHSTTDTTIQNPPHPSGSAHKRPSSSPSPISIQHRKTSSFPSPINSQHRRPPSSSSPTCTRPKLPPASPTPINSQHRKATVSSSPNRNTSRAEVKPTKQDSKKKDLNVGSGAWSPSASTKVQLLPKSRKDSSSPNRSPPKSIRSRSTPPQQLELPPVPEEDASVYSSALSPGSSRPVQALAVQQEKRWKENLLAKPRSNMPNNVSDAVNTAAHGGPLEVPASPSAPRPPQVLPKPPRGATSPEEASRLLAERRREARLKREREEQERLQRETEERQRQDALERRRAEEQARQEAEAQRLVEEKRRRDEEEQRRAEEERAQAVMEAALLQKQREEEQARERARAEQLRQERELLAQKEDAARQARKKRLEEIMRRTRRTDSADTRSESAKALPNPAQPKENTQPVHSGTIEDAARLPVGTKTSQLVLTNEEDMVPVVAFKERRSLRTLTGLEEIQTHQRAEVI